MGGSITSSLVLVMISFTKVVENVGSKKNIHSDPDHSTSHQSSPEPIASAQHIPGYALVISDLEPSQEYQRIKSVFERATGEHWQSKLPFYDDIITEQDGAKHDFPWLVEIGVYMRSHFVQVCSGSHVYVGEEESDILITSADCGVTLIEEASRSAHGIEVHFSGISSGSNTRRVTHIKFGYHHETSNRPLIALLKLHRILELQGPKLHLPEEQHKAVGQVVWRVQQDVPPMQEWPGEDPPNEHDLAGLARWYQKIYVPYEQHSETASVSSVHHGRLSNPVFNVALRNHPQVPANGLGGSPFVIQGNGDTVLKGIRMHLEGDEFADIHLFTKWIKKEGTSKYGWMSMPKDR